MTTTTHATEISASDTVPTITIVREFDAPPDRVFRAWTEPDLVVQWMGPRDVAMTIDHWDCRTGGSYRYVARQEGVDDSAFFGSFHEIRAPHRMVQTFTWEPMPENVALETMTFEELPGGRTRAVACSLLSSFEARDGMLSSGMDVGLREGFAKLDELLAGHA